MRSPLQDGFWGERHGQIIDPFAQRWGLAQHLEDVPHDELVRRATELFRRNGLAGAALHR